MSERLQWVHGSRTVVNIDRSERCVDTRQLQWVHGSRTVVNNTEHCICPASLPGFNGSTVREPWLMEHEDRTGTIGRSFNGSTVREPWLIHCGQG